MTTPSLDADVAVLKNDMQHVASAVAAIATDIKTILKWQEDKIRDSNQVRGDFKTMIDRIEHQTATLTKIVTDDKNGLVPRLGKIEESYSRHVVVDGVFRAVGATVFTFGIGFFVWAYEHLTVSFK
jgi:hypothetical protein